MSTILIIAITAVVTFLLTMVVGLIISKHYIEREVDKMTNKDYIDIPIAIADFPIRIKTKNEARYKEISLPEQIED